MTVDSESVVWHARPAGGVQRPYSARLVVGAAQVLVKPLWPMIYIMSTTRGAETIAQMIQSPQENRANRADNAGEPGIVDNPAGTHYAAFVFKSGFVATLIEVACNVSRRSGPGLHDEGYTNRQRFVKRTRTGPGAWLASSEAVAAGAGPQ